MPSTTTRSICTSSTCSTTKDYYRPNSRPNNSRATTRQEYSVNTLYRDTAATIDRPARARGCYIVIIIISILYIVVSLDYTLSVSLSLSLFLSHSLSLYTYLSHSKSFSLSLSLNQSINQSHSICRVLRTYTKMETLAILCNNTSQSLGLSLIQSVGLSIYLYLYHTVSIYLSCGIQKYRRTTDRQRERERPIERMIDRSILHPLEYYYYYYYFNYRNMCQRKKCEL